MTTVDCSLYLVADPSIGSSALLATVQGAIEGGVTLVQYRDKTASDRDFQETAASLLRLCRGLQVPLIVNDRIDVALAIDADGVHLGVDDVPIAVARRMLGEEAIIGYSPETDEQIVSAAALGATYLGIGPVFGTSTKRDAGAPLGLDEFSRRRRLTALPVVAIGGVNSGNARQCRLAGASGIAVVSAILDATNPRSAAAALVVT